MPSKKLVQFLLSHNKKQSKAFSSPDAVLWRMQYRAKHPTEIAALKCMDGRLNLSIMTNTPPGIIQPFRNIGGKFDLGWPYFGHVIENVVLDALNRGSDSLFLITYHWSKGDAHRGCKGFGYDLEVAKKYAFDLKKQFERIFGKTHEVVYPITVGIETDEDALVIHGENGKVLNMAEEISVDQEELKRKLHALFPDMKDRFIQDFLPLLEGNISHLKYVRSSKRPITILEHHEQILAVGRGFDWLHFPNKALIVGPYSFNLHEPIITAANILLDNIENKKIPKNEGVVALIASLYHNDGPDKMRALEKAKSLEEFTRATIEQEVPKLFPHIQFLTGTVDFHTRLFTVVK